MPPAACAVECSSEFVSPARADGAMANPPAAHSFWLRLKISNGASRETFAARTTPRTWRHCGASTRTAASTNRASAFLRLADSHNPSLCAGKDSTPTAWCLPGEVSMPVSATTPRHPRRKGRKMTQYSWTVIGAGPAGIAAVGRLLDHGIVGEQIAWIDPEFGAGDFGTKW